MDNNNNHTHEAKIQQNVGGTSKVERKDIEKRRRIEMKSLLSDLNSLLPTHHSNEVPLTVSEQIEEATKYIKSLETKMKQQKEKKEKLLRRSNGSSYSAAATAPTRGHNNSNLPELRIREMGSVVEVVFTTGLEDSFVFSDVINVLREERVEIINVNYFVTGNTVFYSLHAEIEDVVYELEATKLTERLQRLVHKWKSTDEEMQAAKASSWSDQGTNPVADTPTTSFDCPFWSPRF